jgi:hypothetical protein
MNAAFANESSLLENKFRGIFQFLELAVRLSRPTFMTLRLIILGTASSNIQIV